MNYRPNPNRQIGNYNLSVGASGERIIPLLTGFALGAPFWGSLGRPPYGGAVAYPAPYPYPYPAPYPYPYPYPYQYNRRKRWY